MPLQATSAPKGRIVFPIQTITSSILSPVDLGDHAIARPDRNITSGLIAISADRTKAKPKNKEMHNLIVHKQ